MSYYRILDLEREPFSTSPDPAFFYLSRVHKAALFRLRVAIELKRGLSLVAGDIGTGKTTLTRRLSQIFYEDPKLDFHVILNPMHHSEEEFLLNLMSAFHIESHGDGASAGDCLQAIEKYLYQKGVEEKKTVVLLIDEAQLLSCRSLEMLRGLLNYETNEHKLLQVILFGQMELVHKLKQMANLWDRISLKMKIPPLDEQCTREMIEFRLRQASYRGQGPLFTKDACRLIYKKSGGFPRRITLLCHDALEYLVMMERPVVDAQVVREVVRYEDGLLTGVSRES